MSTETGRAGSGGSASGGAAIEQQLRARMDRVQVRLDPGLARVAYRAHRRHRIVTRSVAAAGTAAVPVAATAWTAWRRFR